MNKYNVSFFRKGKRPEKNLIVEATTEADAEAMARQSLGVADDRFRVQVQVLSLDETVSPEPESEPVEAETTTEADAEAMDVAPPESGPTLAELGIDGEPAELLTKNGLTDLGEILGYGDLTKIKGIGPATAAEIAKAIDAYEKG